MNIELLHNSCKDATRKAFDEYKRQIDVVLFPFNTSLHENFKKQMFQDIGMQVYKLFINSNNLSTPQLKVLSNTISQYKAIASKTADNYCKRFL